MGDASSEEAANTGALSSLSANATSRHENGNRLFGRTLNRTLTSSPPSTERGLTATSPPLPPPAPAASSSGLNSPTTSLSPAAAGGAAAAAVAGQLPPKAATTTTSARPPRAQQNQRRPPPTPWAPWRRQPSEPSIAPVSSSPAETAEMMNMEEGNAGAVAGAVATAGIRGGGPCIAARAIPSLSSLESLVMLMPPSPATPPEEDCDSGPGPFGKQNPLAAAGGLEAGGAGARMGDGTTVDEEEKKEGELGDGKTGVETCAQFAEKSGFVPFRGYQPSDAWLAVAMQKEEKQKGDEAERARRAGHPTLGRVVPLKEMVQEEKSVASRTERTTSKAIARNHTLVQQSSDAGPLGERKVPGYGDTSPRSPSVTSASPQQPPGPGLLPGRAFRREREVSPPPSRPSPLPLSMSSSSSRSFMPPASPANSTSLGGAECSSSHSPAAPSQRSSLKGCTSPTASQLSASPLKGCFSPVAESQLSTYSEEEEKEEADDLDVDVDVEIARACEEGPAPFSGSPSPEKELLGCSITAAEEQIATEEQIAAGEKSGAEEGSPSPSTSASPPSPQPVVAQRRCVAEVGSEPPGAVAGGVATGTDTGTGSSADSGSRDQAAEEKRGPPVSPAEIPLPPSPPHPPPGRSPTPPPLPDGDSIHAVDETPERLRSPVTTPPPAERPERARKAPRIVARKTGQTKRPRLSRTAAAGAAPPSAAVSSSVEMKRPARAQPARARAWCEPPHAPAAAAAAAAAPQHQQQALAVIPSAPPFAAAPWPSSLGTLSQFAAGTRISPTPSAMLLSPSPKTPPPLSLTTVGAPPCHLLFTPPSPAGGSSSASPTSSFRTSPVPRPPLLPPAVVLSGRDLPPSDPAAAALLAWSLSDSTLSGCSRPGTGGGGGGTSSIPVSVCSEAASPLVGMRFVAKDGGGGGGGGGSSSSRSRPNSWSDHGGGVPLIGVRGSPPLGHPPSVPVALCGVGRPAASAEEEGGAAAGAGHVAAAVAGGGTAGVVDESSCEGGVGGRRGKRPRRYFFP
ncbi:unnamed protein product [Ectocarpus sp. 8 AP-2014]